MSSIRYRAEIDGLRALAVLPVVLFHLGLGFPGGFTGVDVFFVISGFLICGIILRELNEERFSVVRFYERRVRRILPAFFAVIGVSLVLGSLVLYPSDFDLMGHHLSYISLFASNIELSLFEGGYWSADAKSFPLLHTWSLAVEEQFYFVVPFLIWACHRWAGKRTGLALTLLFFGSLGWSVYESAIQPQKAFYLLPARAWEMLLGGLTFLLVQKKCPWGLGSRLAGSLGGLSLALMLVSYFAIDGTMVFPGWIALLPTVGAALFIYSNAWSCNWSGRLLSTAPFRFIGQVSYSFYLWHWPLIIFYKAHRFPYDLSVGEKFGLFVVSLLAAIASWKWIEQPFRKPSVQGSSALRAMVPACAILILLFAVSLGIRKFDGFPQRIGWIESEEVKEVKRRQEELGLAGSQSEFNATALFESGGYQVKKSEDEVPRVVVLGDSHAGMYGPVLAELARSYDTPTAFFTCWGERPIFEGDADTNRKIIDQIEGWKPRAVLIIMRMEHLVGELGGDHEKLKHWSEAVARLASNCETAYFVVQTPKSVEYELKGDSEMLLYRLISVLLDQGNGSLPELVKEPDVSSHARLWIREWLGDLDVDNLLLLDPGEHILAGQDVAVSRQGRLFYMDDDHLSNFGAEAVAPLFEKVFVTELATTSSSSQE